MIPSARQTLIRILDLLVISQKHKQPISFLSNPNRKKNKLNQFSCASSETIFIKLSYEEFLSLGTKHVIARSSHNQKTYKPTLAKGGFSFLKRNAE